MQAIIEIQKATEQMQKEKEKFDSLHKKMIEIQEDNPLEVNCIKKKIIFEISFQNFNFFYRIAGTADAKLKRLVLVVIRQNIAASFVSIKIGILFTLKYVRVRWLLKKKSTL